MEGQRAIFVQCAKHKSLPLEKSQKLLNNFEFRTKIFGQQTTDIFASFIKKFFLVGSTADKAEALSQ